MRLEAREWVRVRLRDILLSAILGPFSKKNVWPGPNVRSRIPERKGRRFLHRTGKITITRNKSAGVRGQEWGQVRSLG